MKLEGDRREMQKRYAKRNKQCDTSNYFFQHSEIIRTNNPTADSCRKKFTIRSHVDNHVPYTGWRKSYRAEWRLNRNTGARFARRQISGNGKDARTPNLIVFLRQYVRD